MITIGFAIKKNELWYSVLEGNNKLDAHIIACEKHIFQSSSATTDLMLTFKNLFNEILGQYSPQKVACKLHLNSSIKQIPYMNYSIGILALICKERGISFQQRSNTWITASKRKKETECLLHFNDDELKNEKLHATIIAWYEFG